MIEILHPSTAPGARAAVFDFDGTLSVIRAGWNHLMLAMMLETLTALDAGESPDDLRALAEDLIGRTTGRETLQQMVEFAHQVELRGGALDPADYKDRFVQRLRGITGQRIDSLRSRRCPPDAFLVPGARPFLQALQARGLRLYLASGTDEAFVREEVALLDLAGFFEDRIYGARDHQRSFAKRAVLEDILAAGTPPSALIGFGDGNVEIAEMKRAGGIAVGLATEEPACLAPDPAKRRRLIAAGADYILPNYLQAADLLASLEIAP